MRVHRKRSPLRVAMWCIVLLVVAVAVVGTLALSPPPEPDPIAAVPPSQLAAGRARVEKAIAQVRQAPSSAAAEAQRSFSISLTDRDLNAFLATDPRMLHAMAKRGVEWARVKLGDGQVTMVALARVRRRRITATITGTLAPSSGGRILFLPTAISVGRLGLPGLLESRVAAEIQRRLPDEAYRVRGEVSRVEVTPGHLLVEGTVEPNDTSHRDEEAAP